MDACNTLTCSQVKHDFYGEKKEFVECIYVSKVEDFFP